MAVRGVTPMLRVERHELGRRLWIRGCRCHHWHVGAALMCAGVLLPNPAGPVLFGVGVALACDDWRDLPLISTRLEPA